MANAHLAAFLYQASVAAIQNEGTDPEVIMETAERVAIFRESGWITDAQVDGLAEMIGVEVDVPDAPDTFDAEVAALRGDVDDLTDGVAELGELLSGVIDPEEE